MIQNLPEDFNSALGIFGEKADQDLDELVTQIATRGSRSPDKFNSAYSMYELYCLLGEAGLDKEKHKFFRKRPAKDEHRVPEDASAELMKLVRNANEFFVVVGMRERTWIEGTPTQRFDYIFAEVLQPMIGVAAALKGRNFQLEKLNPIQSQLNEFDLDHLIVTMDAAIQAIGDHAEQLVLATKKGRKSRSELHEYHVWMTFLLCKHLNPKFRPVRNPTNQRKYNIWNASWLLGKRIFSENSLSEDPFDAPARKIIAHLKQRTGEPCNPDAHKAAACSPPLIAK